MFEHQSREHEGQAELAPLLGWTHTQSAGIGQFMTRTGLKSPSVLCSQDAGQFSAMNFCVRLEPWLQLLLTQVHSMCI